jgi:hypothetical protein
MEPTLVVDALAAFATAALLARVGVVLVEKRARRDAGGALAAFAAWWFAVALLLVVYGVMHAAAGLGWEDLTTYLALVYVSIPLTCAGLGALLYYLLYVFTGSRRLVAPLAAAYGALLLWILYYFTASGPMGVDAQPWSMRFVYANDPGGFPLAATVALMIGPHVLATAWYMLLFFRVEDKTARYRIALVTGALLTWFMSTLFASEMHVVQDSTLGLASRVLGLAAAIAVLLAYSPPAWVRRRLDAPPAARGA